MDRIHIEGMTFYGYHGVFPEENKLGQRFMVNIDMYLDLRDAIRSDSVSDTVDYGAVYQVTSGIMEGTPRKLIETVAGEVCTEVLEQFPRVTRVVVEIFKPSAPIPGALCNVSARIDRSR